MCYLAAVDRIRDCIYLTTSTTISTSTTTSSTTTTTTTTGTSSSRISRKRMADQTGHAHHMTSHSTSQHQPDHGSDRPFKKATFTGNEMRIHNTGSGSVQAGIRTAATGDMLVECTDNKQTMENENAQGCLQAAFMRDGGAGAKGSTAVQSSGNEMVMKNKGETSGCIQAGVIGSVGTSSGSHPVSHSKWGGNTMHMQNSGNACGNIQVGGVMKMVRRK